MTPTPPYIYGLLHSSDYRAKYADNLSKELPRIPCVKKFDDFRQFVEAGKALAELHLNYENANPFNITFKQGRYPTPDDLNVTPDYVRVKKMRFGKNGNEKDKTTIIYNDNITISDIPLDAYKYVVNGKSAIEWVMDRQTISTDKDSGLVKDANDYARQTKNSPVYPLQLLLCVITVSIETLKITRNLPKMEV